MTLTTLLTWSSLKPKTKQRVKQAVLIGSIIAVGCLIYHNYYYKNNHSKKKSVTFSDTPTIIHSNYNELNYNTINKNNTNNENNTNYTNNTKLTNEIHLNNKLKSSNDSKNLNKINKLAQLNNNNNTNNTNSNSSRNPNGIINDSKKRNNRRISHSHSNSFTYLDSPESIQVSNAGLDSVNGEYRFFAATKCWTLFRQGESLCIRYNVRVNRIYRELQRLQNDENHFKWSNSIKYCFVIGNLENTIIYYAAPCLNKDNIPNSNWLPISGVDPSPILSEGIDHSKINQNKTNSFISNSSNSSEEEEDDEPLSDIE